MTESNELGFQLDCWEAAQEQLKLLAALGLRAWNSICVAGFVNRECWRRSMHKRWTRRLVRSHVHVRALAALVDAAFPLHCNCKTRALLTDLVERIASKVLGRRTTVLAAPPKGLPEARPAALKLEQVLWPQRQVAKSWIGNKQELVQPQRNGLCVLFLEPGFLPQVAATRAV